MPTSAAMSLFPPIRKKDSFPTESQFSFVHLYCMYRSLIRKPVLYILKIVVQVQLKSAELHKIENGRINGHWDVMGQLILLKQTDALFSEMREVQMPKRDMNPRL